MPWILASFQDEWVTRNPHSWFFLEAFQESLSYHSYLFVPSTPGSFHSRWSSTRWEERPGSHTWAVQSLDVLEGFWFAEKEAWIEFRILCLTQFCTDSVVALEEPAQDHEEPWLTQLWKRLERKIATTAAIKIKPCLFMSAVFNADY